MSSSVFRIDKFVVPEGGKHEFVQRVRETHEFLRTLPGFVRDLVVEKTAGAGVFNYVTLVEWESEEAISAAKNAVHAHHAARNFSPQELWSRLGIEADLANYQEVVL
ncbi:MAG: antibiotic biosynthesis monooxygenase family protein [Thiobacillus sp.]